MVPLEDCGFQLNLHVISHEVPVLVISQRSVHVSLSIFYSQVSHVAEKLTQMSGQIVFFLLIFILIGSFDFNDKHGAVLFFVLRLPEDDVVWFDYSSKKIDIVFGFDADISHIELFFD